MNQGHFKQKNIMKIDQSNLDQDSLVVGAFSHGSELDDEYVINTEERQPKKHRKQCFSPGVNQIRGIAPQKPLLQSHRVDDSLMEAVQNSIQASTVGAKDQFLSEISMHRVEPKRSVSVSARQCAEELQRPYNRRAAMLRERKEQLKQQTREDSFQRSQKKNESVSRIYTQGNDIDQTQSLIFSQNALLQKRVAFNQSMSVSGAYQTQYRLQPQNQHLRGSLINYDALNHSSFDFDQMLSQGKHPPLSDARPYQQQQQLQPLIKFASKILPGNQQQMGQSLANSVDQDSGDLASGIERAKQVINEKFQSMIDWSQFQHHFSGKDEPDTIRSFGKATQRAINQNIQTRNAPPPDFDRQQTFGMQSFNVFTPPAGKQFSLPIEDDLQIKNSAFTVREAEGAIPHPMKSPQKLLLNQQSFSWGVHRNGHPMLTTPVTRLQASVKKHAVGMTLNPNGQHGVALTADVRAQKVSDGEPEETLKSKTVSQFQQRLAAQSSAKSTKSLKDLLSVADRSFSNGPIQNKRLERPALDPHSHEASTACKDASLFNSASQVQSPRLNASVYVGGAKHSQQLINVDRSLLMSDQMRLSHQEEYPCSAFFQNADNFEKAPPKQHVKNNTVDCTVQGAGFTPLKTPLYTFETIDGAANRVLHRPLNISPVRSEQQIAGVSIHPPCNAQGEVRSPQSCKQAPQYPITIQSKTLSRQKQLQHFSSLSHQSVQVRKTFSNFTKSPILDQRILHHKVSPSFNVVQQQRENSQGRCSIVSLAAREQLNEEDLPPDPLLQPCTMESARQDAPDSKQRNCAKKREEPLLRKQQLGRVSYEILAVAPKLNQISMIEQASERSICMTVSNSKIFHSSRQSEATVTIDNEPADSSKRTLQIQSPTSKLLLSGPTTLSRVFRNSPPAKETQAEESVTMIRIDDEDRGLTEEERMRQRRASSFIRDGYEVYVEGTYIVNGRKKKKIKKRKLSKAQLERHKRELKEGSRLESKTEVAASLRLESEMDADGDLNKLSQLNHPGQRVVTQASIKSTAVRPVNVRLQQQTISQSNIMSPQSQLSPRSIKNLPVKKPQFKLPVSKAQQEQKLVTRVKIANPNTGRSGTSTVQVPRNLLIKKSTLPCNTNPEKSQRDTPEEVKDRHLDQESAADEKKGTGDLDNSASVRSLNFRDPDLQLVTSSRILTIRDVSMMLFEGCHRFVLHRMIFQRRFPELLKVFKSGLLKQEQLDERDHQGNTPLLLAAKLSANEEEYLKCINFLFKQGCNGKLRDGNGWSILDEAIGQANSRLLAISFGWLNIHKKEKIQRNKARVLQRLTQIPDFYCELHWECQSSWIPFLSKIAPSDDFQIWKVGSNIRLDFSLVGFKHLQNKRRRMSILFRNAAVDEVDERYKHIDILMVNRDREILSNPLEDLDDEEKLAVLTDIMNADPVQNELNIQRQEWSQIHNFFGTGAARDTINGYDCSRFKLQIHAQVRSKKKLNQRFEHTYASYFEGAEDFKEGQQFVSDPTSFKMAKDVEKQVESQLWLSQDFPLQFAQFMEVLDTLAISGQASMQKIHEFLQNEGLKEVISKNGFPVKIQVPIGMIVKAMVTFGNFQFLNPENKDRFISETFKVPDSCRLVSRKEAQKTLESKKKRLAVANVVI